MSTTQTATTTLYVNGRPAQEEIGRLRGTLDKLKKDLQDIAKDQNQGINSPAWKKVQAEIKKTEKELDRVQSGVANVKQTMVSLDKATPKQLRKALKELKAELEGIERGSKAWDEQVNKIRSVQKELDILNGKADKQGNLWDRFAKKMFDWGAAIQTTMAAITGITMTARQAVQAYADMDAEMASVRKFTGMAVAAGMMQVAAIKKQQQASQAQSYAEGGFTRPGRVDEVAGVVHAGEWVASQRLLASPVARPLIEALDYAQRTNTIGSLRQTDVSRTITAPAVLAQSQAPMVIVQENNALRETIARLNERLNEPFVTVNTVTGDLGIKQAQDDYQRLMNNKSPKSKRK